MQLFLKPEAFSDSFVSLLESTSNFKHFDKKEDRHSYFMSEFTDCQRLGCATLEKHRFRVPFFSQHVKASQTLVTSA